MMNVGLTCCRKRKKKKVGAKIRDEERDDVELRSQGKKKKKVWCERYWVHHDKAPHLGLHA